MKSFRRVKFDRPESDYGTHMRAVFQIWFKRLSGCLIQQAKPFVNKKPIHTLK
jgi:hypothetical protein